MDFTEFPRHPAKRSQWLLWVLGLMTLPMVFGLLFWVIALWRHFANRYSCDGDFVRNNYGIISRDKSAVRIRDLRAVNLKQSIFGRLLKYGTLSFDTAAGDRKGVVWWGVRNAPDIQEWFEAEMRRRSVAT